MVASRPALKGRGQHSTIQSNAIQSNPMQSIHRAPGPIYHALTGARRPMDRGLDSDNWLSLPGSHCVDCLPAANRSQRERERDRSAESGAIALLEMGMQIELPLQPIQPQLTCQQWRSAALDETQGGAERLQRLGPPQLLPVQLPVHQQVSLEDLFVGLVVLVSLRGSRFEVCLQV